MNTLLEVHGETQLDLSDKGRAMLTALRGVLEDAVEREQQQ